MAGTLDRDPRAVDRSGAAGGFAGGMWAQFDASPVSGADFVLDLLETDVQIAASDAVVGEGRLDSQTSQGKIIAAILARSGQKPVYAVVVGSVHEDLVPPEKIGPARAEHSCENSKVPQLSQCSARAGVPALHDRNMFQTTLECEAGQIGDCRG